MVFIMDALPSCDLKADDLLLSSIVTGGVSSNIKLDRRSTCLWKLGYAFRRR